MSHSFLFALWFFTPAGLANLSAVLASHTPVLKRWRAPIDGGMHFKGKRLLGDHKTWRGLVSGLIVGTLVAWAQLILFEHSAWIRQISVPVDYSQIPVFSLGFLMSLGALGGDAAESFFKRRMDVASGDSWFPFDQCDYIVGGLLLASLIIRLSLAEYLWVLVTWFGLHLLFSYGGYLLNLKHKPI